MMTWEPEHLAIESLYVQAYLSESPEDSRALEEPF